MIKKEMNIMKSKIFIIILLMISIALIITISYINSKRTNEVDKIIQDEEFLISIEDEYNHSKFDELELEENNEEKNNEEDKHIEETKEVEKEMNIQEEKDESVVGEEATNNNEVSNTISNTNASENSSQLITVVSTGGSTAELVRYEKDENKVWNIIDKVSAIIGANGMKDASLVYEMDKCTPTGSYSLTEAFGINQNPGSKIPYRQLDGSEYWIDDENSEYYNTLQFGDSNGRWNSAEHLVSFITRYNYSVVIDYNRTPVIPGKSSAIFLHVGQGAYTYGCVGVSENQMIKILQWLDPSKNPRILLDFSYDAIYSKY